MRNLVKPVFLLWTFLVVILGDAYACTCIPTPSIKDNWEEANQVFIGVVEKSDTLGNYFSSSGYPVELYTIRILESFKDRFHEKLPLRTFLSYGSGACDSYFNAGEKYLIYAHEETYSGFLRSSECGRTAKLSQVDKSEILLLKKLSQDYLTLKEKKEAPSYIEQEEYEIRLLKDTNIGLTNTIWYISIASGTIITFLAILLITSWRRRKKTNA